LDGGFQSLSGEPSHEISSKLICIPEQAVQETDLQDESIRELASDLREMLGTANMIPDLPVIPNTTNVIEEISRQSLQVASLIHEYTKLPWAGNTVPLLLDLVKSNDGLFVGRTIKIQIPGDLKSRIDGCRKRCATLKVDFYSRLHLDTNTQVKEIKAGLHQNGTSLLARRHPPSGLFTANIGGRLEAIVHNQLGTFEFFFSSIIRSIFPADKIHQWLSPPDNSSNRNEVHGKRQVDTCSWFLDGERFLRWQENPGFIWVKGKRKFLSSSI